MADKLQVRFCGYGGQGIILAGFITGQAVTVYENRHAIFIQDYGPEARGGSCKADVIISDEPVRYPYIDIPAVMVAMSQAAYDKYISKTGKDTVVIIEQGLVKPQEQRQQKVLIMPARKLAGEAGRAAVANVVMLGFFDAVTGAVGVDALKKSVLSSVPKNTGDLNMRAFELGYKYGKEQLGR